MEQDLQRIRIAKDLIQKGSLEQFKDLFLYVYKTDIAARLGINYTRFLELIKNPKKFRIEEVYHLARIFQVTHTEIYNLITSQIDASKPGKKNKPA